MGEYGNEQRHHTNTRRGKGEIEDMGINRDSIPSQGEVRERWENMGINRDIIPTQAEVRGRWEIWE